MDKLRKEFEEKINKDYEEGGFLGIEGDLKEHLLWSWIETAIIKAYADGRKAGEEEWSQDEERAIRGQ